MLNTIVVHQTSHQFNSIYTCLIFD